MKKLSITLCMAFVVFLTTKAQEKILLRLNPEKGKSTPFEMIMKSDIEGPQSMIMDMNMSMTMTATEVAESIKFDSKYSRVRMDIDAGIVTMSYDSDKAPANQMEEMIAAQLKPLMESTMSMTMSPQAKVEDIDFPNVPEQAFDRSSVQSMSVAFPEHAVAIGDSWTGDATLPQIGVQSISTNTLAEKNADGYKVNVTAIYKNEKGEEIGTGEGYYILNPVTFFTTDSSMKVSMDLNGSKITSTVELREIK